MIYLLMTVGLLVAIFVAGFLWQCFLQWAHGGEKPIPQRYGYDKANEALSLGLVAAWIIVIVAIGYAIQH